MRQRVSLTTLVCLITICLGFWLRIRNIDDVRHEYDRSYPHGVGVAIADSIGSADFWTHALHGQRQSLGLPNPLAANFVYALLTPMARSPLVATLLTAMASSLVIAVAFRLGQWLGSGWSGVIAAGIAATNPWSIYFARGTWQLGLFEVAIAFAAWLTFDACRRMAPRRLIASALLTMWAMHLYTVGMGLAAQWLLCVGIAAVAHRRREFTQAAFVGAGICLLGVALYAAQVGLSSTNVATNNLNLAYAEGTSTLRVGNLYLPYSVFTRLVDWVTGWHFDLSNASVIGGEPTDSGLDRAMLGWQWVRGLLIASAFAIGMARLLRHARAHWQLRWALGWGLVPVLLIFVVTFYSPRTPTNYQYMLLATPLVYVWAGNAFANLRLQKLTAAIATLLVIILAAGPTFAHQSAATRIHADHPTTRDGYEQGTPISMILRDQMVLHNDLAAHCRQVLVDDNPFENRLNLYYWTASVVGTSQAILPASASLIDLNQTWLVPSTGGACVARVAGPAPSFADVHALRNGLVVYRSRSLSEILAAPNVAHFDLPNNLGWRLVAQQRPPRAQRGSTVEIAWIWTIEQLPAEPYAGWRYDPFLVLRGPDQTEIRADGPSVSGASWQVGQVIISSIRLEIPTHAPVGQYQISSSLFDRHQQKNAAYFLANGTVATEISGTLEIY